MRLSLSDAAVEVATFSDLARSLGEDAGLLPKGAPIAPGQTADIVFDSLASRPDLAYDAVVVDEAQDFPPHVWVAVDALASRTDAAALHAYYDSNQRIYGELRGQFDSYTLLPIRLSRNLRNTQHIHEATQRFYRGPSLTADGPLGATVQWIESDDDRIEKRAIDEIRKLVNAESVLPGDIAVLSVDSAPLRRISASLTDQIDSGLTLSTISNFKGLERRFVVLLATRELSDAPDLAYVALSRARVYLVVIGASAVLRWLQSDAAAI